MGKKEKSQYKIIFDSNLIRRSPEDESSQILNEQVRHTYEFLKSNNLLEETILSIPEVVIEELIGQRLLKINVNLQKVEDVFKELSSFGVKKLSSAYQKKDYRSILKKKAMAQLKSIGDVSLLRIPPKDKLKPKDILERVYMRQKPFSESGKSDKGFKDTLIWLSILYDAKKNSNTTYIFCTDNLKDFPEEDLRKEFSGYSSSTLQIFGSIQDLKEYLDKTFTLDLQLESIRKEIETDLNSRPVDLIQKLNDFWKQRQPNSIMDKLDHYSTSRYSVSSSLSARMSISIWGEEEIKGYDYNGPIRITNIKRQSEDDIMFRVTLQLNAVERGIRQEKDRFSVLSVSSSSSEQPFSRPVDLEVVLDYNRRNKSINFLSIF